MSAAYSAGLVAPISEYSATMSSVQQLSARRHTLPATKMTANRQSPEALDPEIVLIRNFYMRHKYTSDAIETAKKDSDPFSYQKLSRDSSSTQPTTGHYERERLENI